MDRAARPGDGKSSRDLGAPSKDRGDGMQTIGLKTLGTIIAVVAAVVAALDQPAAQDKVKVGVFPTASSLPYFVAIERGFFKEQNIEPRHPARYAARTCGSSINSRPLPSSATEP